MLTVERWNALSDEERQERVDEMPEELKTTPPQVAKESVVIIDGKEIPLKNVIGEAVRKAVERTKAEILASAPLPTPQPINLGGEEPLKRVMEDAEREMAETGSTFPVKTVLRLIGEGSRYHIKETTDSIKKSTKILKETKRTLRKEYKDFGDYEDEFDEIVDNATPDQITPTGLKMVFEAIRGRKLDEKLRDLQGKPPEEPIIGPSAGSGGGAGKPPKEKLTDAQKKEMAIMNFETEDAYLNVLKPRQQRAKDMGLKKIPQTIGEPLQRE